jgi:hypothetical protein
VKSNEIKSALYWVDNRIRIKDPMALQVSLNSADYISANAITMFDMSVHMVTNDDEAMAHAKSAGYDYALLCRFGNVFDINSDWLDRLAAYIKQNHPVHCMAHLVDERPKAYVKLHHQCVLINVNTWKQAGEPKWGPGHMRGGREVAALRRSEENYHDHYTPFWIEHDADQPDYIVPYTSEGYGIITAFVKAGIRIWGFPTELRETKMYLYPDVYDDVNDKMQDMYYEIDRWKSGFYAVNTEKTKSRPGEDFNMPVRQLIAPCSGLLPWEYILEKGMTADARFTFYDSNPHSIAFYTQLLERWDGSDYPSFVLNFMQGDPRLLKAFAKRYTEVKSYWQSVEAKATQAGYLDFQQFWSKFKQNKYHIEQLNILDPTRFKRLGAIDNSPDSVLMLSNIFRFFPTSAFTSLYGVFQQEAKLHKLLYKRLPDITVINAGTYSRKNNLNGVYHPGMMTLENFGLPEQLHFPWRQEQRAQLDAWYKTLLE